MIIDVVTLLVAFVLLCLIVMALEGRVRRVEDQMKSHREKHNRVEKAGSDAFKKSVIDLQRSLDRWPGDRR